MRWVHLRINTRVRVLGRLGCTGAFIVELSSTLWVRLKNRPPLFTVKNWAADKKQGYVDGAQHVIYTIGTHSIYS